MRKALINKAGLVVNIIDLEDGADWTLPDGYSIVDAAGGNPGDTWDGKQFVSPPPPAPRAHKVSTYRILRRLEDAGLIDVAETALNANRTLFRRFYTVGAISADEPEARAFLRAIGADPDAILAPE